MASRGAARTVHPERHRSYGIGGAGNMRREASINSASSAEPMSLVDRFHSRGVGGAGNMRRGSEIAAAEELLKNMPPTEPRERRNSVWSIRSDTSRGGSIVDAFTGLFSREGSVKSEKTLKEDVPTLG